MRAATFLRQLPWVAWMLVSCGDSLVAGGLGSGSDSDSDFGSSSGGSASTSDAEDTTAGGSSETGSADTTGSAGSTGDARSNAAPKAFDDVVYARQDTMLTIEAAGLLANDLDSDGDALTLRAVNAVSVQGGTVAVVGDAGVEYEPAAGFWGIDAFDYTIDDDFGAAATATVTVHVAPVQIPLAEVAAGKGGFILDGEAVNDFSGVSVSGAGDVDGDGKDDILVGAYHADADADAGDSGRSYVVFGKADTAAVDGSAITAGAGGFVIDGEVSFDRSGGSVSSAGDVNGDGLGDLIVGADGADPNGDLSGRSYVVFGKADTAAVQLSAVLEGVGGFVLNGEAPTDRLGWSVSGAGDVNGDGLEDLIVAAAGDFPVGSEPSRTYVVFGKADTAPIDLSTIAAGLDGGFVLIGEGIRSSRGVSVSGAGDVNGDGLGDVIVGISGADANDEQSGRSYVVFGKSDAAPVELSDIEAGSGGFALTGEHRGDASGGSVSGVGDMNGDGMDDLLVGATGADPNGEDSGRTYVVFGKSDTTSVNLSEITAGIGGFVVNGESRRDRSGRSASGAGDVNGDGILDIIIGATGANPNGRFSGRTYVVFGKADNAAVDLSDVAAGLGGFFLDGEAAEDFSGHSVSGAGDVNADGIDDIIVGANGADPNGLGSGRSYVVFGVATGES